VRWAIEQSFEAPKTEWGMDCPFRTLFWNSEAILPGLLQSGEAELATDVFIAPNYLLL